MDYTQIANRLQKLSTEVDIRKEKINILKENGIVPYVGKFERSCTIKEAMNKAEGEKVAISGRIIFRRIMGKFGFMKIQDIEGAIQVSVGRNELSEEDYDFYKKMIQKSWG